MSVIIPKLRQMVEVWFRTKPPLPVAEFLADLEPDNFRIVDTRVPAREVGDTLSELAWLVRTLTKPYKLGDGTVFRPGNGDLIVVPGSKIVLRLLIYPEFPRRLFGMNVMPFGNHRYAIRLGAYLRNGSDHPCYRQIHATGTACGVRQRGANEFGYPE